MSRTRNLVSVSQYPADRACARISAQGHSQGISSSALPVPLLPADEGRRRGEAAPPVAGVGLGERREATRLRFSELRAASPLQSRQVSTGLQAANPSSAARMTVRQVIRDVLPPARHGKKKSLPITMTAFPTRRPGCRAAYTLGRCTDREVGVLDPDRRVTTFDK